MKCTQSIIIMSLIIMSLYCFFPRAEPLAVYGQLEGFKNTHEISAPKTVREKTPISGVPRNGMSIIGGSRQTIAPLVPGPNIEAKLPGFAPVIGTLLIKNTTKRFDNQKLNTNRQNLISQKYM